MSLDRLILARHHRPTRNIGFWLGVLLLNLPWVWSMRSSLWDSIASRPGGLAMPVLFCLPPVLSIALWLPALTPRFGKELPPERVSPFARERMLAGLSPRRRAIVMHPARNRPNDFSRPQYAVFLFGSLTLLLGILSLFSIYRWSIAVQWSLLASTFACMGICVAALRVENAQVHAALDPRLIRIFRGLCRRCTYRFATRETARCPECGQAMGGPRPERPPRRRWRGRQSASMGRSSVTESRPN